MTSGIFLKLQQNWTKFSLLNVYWELAMIFAGHFEEKFSREPNFEKFLATGRLRNPKGRLMEGARPLLANVALLFFFHWEYKHPFLLNLPVHQIIRPFMMQTYISIKVISNSHMYPFITQKSLKYRMISKFFISRKCSTSCLSTSRAELWKDCSRSKRSQTLRIPPLKWAKASEKG